MSICKNPDCNKEFQPNPNKKHIYCSARCRTQYINKTWSLNNRERKTAKARDLTLRKSYGLSLKDVNELLLVQNNLCSLCKKPFLDGEKIQVDHDHSCCDTKASCCGKCIRGLLHSKCNQGLGQFNDNPVLCRMAADYLEARSKNIEISIH
jgi:hypothetical protein